MKTCSTHKKLYPSEAIATDALLEAHTQFEFKPNQGPIAIYLCDECGHYHFTSKGKMNDTLAAYIKDGKLKRMKEASAWEKKWKR